MKRLNGAFELFPATLDARREPQHEFVCFHYLLLQMDLAFSRHFCQKAIDSGESYSSRSPFREQSRMASAHCQMVATLTPSGAESSWAGASRTRMRLVDLSALSGD